jgi:hypothetical protein
MLDLLGEDYSYANKVDAITRVLVQSPTLSGLRHRWGIAWLWTRLLPTAAQLTRLLSLEGVCMLYEDQMQALASLTQLTRLSFSGGGRAGLHVTLLSSLSALQVLSWIPDSVVTDPTMADVMRLGEPMRQLRELDLPVIEGFEDRAQLCSLVGSLPAITKLTVHTRPFRPWPNAISQIVRPCGLSFRRLRYLSTPLFCESSSQAEGVCAALGALHHLEVWGKGRTCSQFLRHLPPMPSLTTLRVHSSPATYNESPGGITCHEAFWGNTSASFLGGVSRLRQLQLEHVLDVWNWDEDVRYVSLLTELTKVEIHGWAPRNHRLGGLPFSYAQVQPLTVLRQLAILHMDYPWSPGINTQEFRDALQGIRHEMGLSPTQITPHMAPVSLWWRATSSQRTEKGRCECCSTAAEVLAIDFLS